MPRKSPPFRKLDPKSAVREGEPRVMPFYSDSTKNMDPKSAVRPGEKPKKPKKRGF